MPKKTGARIICFWKISNMDRYPQENMHWEIGNFNSRNWNNCEIVHFQLKELESSSFVFVSIEGIPTTKTIPIPTLAPAHPLGSMARFWRGRRIEHHKPRDRNARLFLITITISEIGLETTRAFFAAPQGSVHLRTQRQHQQLHHSKVCASQKRADRTATKRDAWPNKRSNAFEQT